MGIESTGSSDFATWSSTDEIGIPVTLRLDIPQVRMHNATMSVVDALEIFASHISCKRNVREDFFALSTVLRVEKDHGQAERNKSSFSRHLAPPRIPAAILLPDGYGSMGQSESWTNIKEKPT